MPEHVVPLPGLVGELLQAGRQRARELQGLLRLRKARLDVRGRARGAAQRRTTGTNHPAARDTRGAPSDIS